MADGSLEGIMSLYHQPALQGKPKRKSMDISCHESHFVCLSLCVGLKSPSMIWYSSEI